MSGDLNPLRGLLALNAELHQCGFLHPIPGRAILAGEFPSRDPFLTDRQFRLERIIGEGDIVALHWSTSGRYVDPDSPKLDGAPIRFSSMTFVRLEDSKIIEIWNIQDTSTLQTRLFELKEATGDCEGDVLGA